MNVCDRQSRYSLSLFLQGALLLLVSAGIWEFVLETYPPQYQVLIDFPGQNQIFAFDITIQELGVPSYTSHATATNKIAALTNGKIEALHLSGDFPAHSPFSLPHLVFTAQKSAFLFPTTTIFEFTPPKMAISLRDITFDENHKRFVRTGQHPQLSLTGTIWLPPLLERSTIWICYRCLLALFGALFLYAVLLGSRRLRAHFFRQ